MAIPARPLSIGPWPSPRRVQVAPWGGDAHPWGAVAQRAGAVAQARPGGAVVGGAPGALVGDADDRRSGMGRVDRPLLRPVVKTLPAADDEVAVERHAGRSH